MDNYPVEFVLITDFEGLGIFSDSFDTDVDITFDGGFRIGKGDDIGQGIVLEKIEVNLVEICIGAENIVDIVQCSSLLIDALANPVSEGFGIAQLGINGFGMKAQLIFLGFGKGGINHWRKISRNLQFKLDFDSTTIIVEEYIIGKLPHEEYPSPSDFEEVFGGRRIGDIVEIKAFSLVRDLEG